MPLPEKLIINIDEMPDKPVSVADPTPFDIDGYVNEWSRTKKIENVPENRNNFSKVIHSLSRPFLAQGYNGMAAVNRGMASFSAHLDAVTDYVEAITGGKKGGVFEKAAEVYDSNADYWRNRAEKVGIGFVDELVSEAVGGFVPGVTTFSLDVASGLTFPFMSGYSQAKKREDNPIYAGLMEAAKTGTLSGLFKMMTPLKQYLKAPTMGTVFGIQEMEGAEEGNKTKAFAKGFGTGVGYSLTSPGGRLGLNEIRKSLEPEIIKVKNNLAPESSQKTPSPVPSAGTSEAPGQIKEESSGKPTAIRDGEPISPDAPTRDFLGKTDDGKPEIREKQANQRKFLKTAEESFTTIPEVMAKVKEIDPQDYIVQPNIESLDKAKQRVDNDGLDVSMDYIKSNSEMNAEKSATFIELMERFQKDGDFDRAVEVIETYDTQLREAGRFIQAASIWNRLTPSGFIRWAEKQIQSTQTKYGWLDTLFNNKPESFKLSAEEKNNIFKRMVEINKMPDGIDKTDATLQVIDIVAKKTPPSVSELIDAYRYQNMLSGPRTHQRNIFENTGNALLKRPIDVTTKGAIDYVKAGLFGKERQAYINDTPVYIKTAINSVPNAAKAFMSVMKAEKGLDIGKPELGVEVKSEFERARFKQIPKTLTFISRFMEAQDKFYSSLIGAGEFAIQKKNGATDAEAYKKADEISQKYLYREKLDPSDKSISYFSKVLSSIGKMVTDSRKLPGLGTLSKWYVPFIRTPVNKGIQMIESSPLGLIRGSVDEEAMAKIISGGIVTAIGAAFAYEGETTWAVPSDPKEKEMFYASGRKPFSVRMGDKWIPVWYLGPYALSFAIPTAIKFYTQDQKKALTESGFEKLLEIANGTARFIGSQTSTQSIGSLFAALSGDVDYTFPATTAFTSEQMIPLQGLVRYTNTILDPVYRKPKGFIEHIEKDLPLLSNSLEERTTPLYEISRRDAINYFVPYDIGASKPLYESMLPQTRHELRMKNIEREIYRLSEKIMGGEISPEESFDKLSNLYEAQIKSLEKFGEELK